MNKKNFLYLIVALFCVNQSNAQLDSKPTVFVYGKWHKFYSAGVYEVGESNNATGKGLGFSVHKDLTKRFSLFGGYSFALADSLPYTNGYTSNAVFHQVEANLALGLPAIWRLKPYIFSGYTYNHIQQIDKFGFNNDGVSINLGTKAEIALTDAFGLGYQMTYGFSISENIPYNFRHQLGVVYHPSKRVNTPKRVKTVSENVVENTDYELLKNQNQKLITRLDSIERVAQDQQPIIQAPAEDKSLIVTYNIQLQEQVKHLEEDNQRLLEELRSKRFISDSIYASSYKNYTFKDTTGQVIATEALNLPSGYYLLSKDFDILPKVKLAYRSESFEPLDLKYVLNRNSYFHVMGFISVSRKEALEYYNSLGDEKYKLAVVLL